MDEADPHEEPEGGGESLSLDADAHAAEESEARSFARLGGWAMPVVVAHGALLFLLLQSAWGFQLPAFLHADRVVAWLWVNGAAIGLGLWLWRRGRVPVGGRRWLRGRRARMGVLLWLAASLAWFLLPAIAGDVWRALSGG
jgi:hypothetical protein